LEVEDAVGVAVRVRVDDVFGGDFFEVDAVLPVGVRSDEVVGRVDSLELGDGITALGHTPAFPGDTFAMAATFVYTAPPPPLPPPPSVSVVIESEELMLPPLPPLTDITIEEEKSVVK